MLRIVQVARVNLGETAGDGRQSVRTILDQVPEQSEFTYSAYLVAAWATSNQCVFDVLYKLVYTRRDTD